MESRPSNANTNRLFVLISESLCRKRGHKQRLVKRGLVSGGFGLGLSVGLELGQAALDFGLFGPERLALCG